jgi:hypothetical protein
LEEIAEAMHVTAEEAAVYEKLRHKAGEKGDCREKHGKENRVFNKGHIRENAHYKREYCSPACALEHAHRNCHSRQHHGAYAENAKLRKHHILRYKREEHEQQISEDSLYVYSL